MIKNKPRVSCVRCYFRIKALSLFEEENGFWISQKYNRKILSEILKDNYNRHNVTDEQTNSLTQIWKYISTLSVTNYVFLYIVWVVGLPMLCLVPCPVSIWGPPWLLTTDSCYWVGWGSRSLNAAFPWCSWLLYFYLIRIVIRVVSSVICYTSSSLIPTLILIS
jgi:hypothetical protein